MKTAVTETSINAYRQLCLSEQQAEVLTAIKVLGESCIADVAAYLGWQRSTVSARMNELKATEPPAIIEVHKRKSKTTQILSEFWKVALFKETLF